MTTKRPLITILTDDNPEPEIREMNDEEYERHLAFLEEMEKNEAQAKAAEIAKATSLAKLEALGLTADDIKAIIG